MSGMLDIRRAEWVCLAVRERGRDHGHEHKNNKEGPLHIVGRLGSEILIMILDKARRAGDDPGWGRRNKRVLAHLCFQGGTVGPASRSDSLDNESMSG